MPIEGKELASQGKRLRYGMVGGGSGAFIGEIHRKAAAFDGNAAIVSGCFSRDFDNTLATGAQLGIARDRLYQDFREMAEKEAARSDKIDFVSIVTPNYAHYDVAKAFLEKGINVVCDKPLATTIEQAEELVELTRQQDLLFAVTYSYPHVPMARHAREMIRRGDIGEIRVVMAEYPQGWLATRVEDTGQRQAAWRTDPKMAGISNCLGDIGSHIEYAVSYITGLEIDSVCAKLDIFGEGRTLDTNAQLLLKYRNGASGTYWSSQVAIGYDNGLKVRVFGTKGSIEWEQEAQNYLKVAMLDGPVQILSRGNGYLYPEAAAMSRTPSGHPEGYVEGFANIYTAFCQAINKKRSGEKLREEDLSFPTVEDGLRGVKFIHRCVESSRKGTVWVKFD